MTCNICGGIDPDCANCELLKQPERDVTMPAIVVKVDDTRTYQARCPQCWWRGKTYYTTRQAVEAAEAHNGAWHSGEDAS